MQGRALCQPAVAALPSDQAGRLTRRAVAAPAETSPRAPATAQPRPRIPRGRTETAGWLVRPVHAGRAHVPLDKGGPDVEAGSSARTRPLSNGERCGRRTAGAIGAAKQSQRRAKWRCARRRHRRSSRPRTRVVARERATWPPPALRGPDVSRHLPGRGRGAGLLGGTGWDGTGQGGQRRGRHLDLPSTRSAQRPGRDFAVSRVGAASNLLGVML